jgi:hypothetical protein
MHQTKNGAQGHFDMMAHIGVVSRSRLVHTVRGTAVSVNDLVEGNSPPHDQEIDVFADAGYQGLAKRHGAKEALSWRKAMRPGKRQALDRTKTVNRLIDEVERLDTSVRAKVAHPFRVIKRQIGHIKVSHRGLKKNATRCASCSRCRTCGWRENRCWHWTGKSARKRRVRREETGNATSAPANGGAEQYQRLEFGRFIVLTPALALNVSSSDCPRAVEAQQPSSLRSAALLSPAHRSLSTNAHGLPRS